MSIADYSKFHTYKNLIQSLPVPFDDEALLNEQFLLEREEYATKTAGLFWKLVSISNARFLES